MTSCRLCQSNELEPQFYCRDQYGDEFKILKCLNCADHFLHPFPNQAQLQRAYANEYYGEGKKKFAPMVERLLNYFRSIKARAMLAYLENGDRILDLGCGDGELLNQIKGFGNFELHGLEIEGKAAERASERGFMKLHSGELKGDSYPEAYFDLVSIIHVFEHLPKPRETVETLGKIIKNGGHLVIEQPNIESWQAKIFKGKWLHLDPPRHLNMLGTDALRKLMEQYGFDCIEESFFSPQFSPFGVQQSLLNLICGKREVLYEHLKGNREYVKEYSGLSLFLQKLFHWLSFPLFVLTDAIASAFRKGGTMKMVFVKKG